MSLSPLSLHRLGFDFSGKPLFEGLSLTLGEENPTVILGPSGCCKTTLLRLMASLLKPRSGEIRFWRSLPATEGPSIAGAGALSTADLFDADQRSEESPRGASPPLPAMEGPAPPVSFVFQEPRLLPWYLVLENVMLPLNRSLGREEAESRARHFLGLVSLDDKLRSYPRELSGGQQQRVSMARAFAHPATLILLDEPFQSLDIPLRLELMDLLLDLLHREQRRAVAVTHDPR